MSAKTLICSGAVTIVLSIVGSFAVIARLLQTVKVNENAGIGAVGAANVEFAFVCIFLFFVGVFVLIFGLIKLYRDKKVRMP
jgi:hypothetical protein